mmetsp:Transcript_47489/g.94847  ORF Transcript_47489/g.94847 Transcript_47489/m.94847 type:complete len:198 (-) Transcript_47489:285-878(-)
MILSHTDTHRTEHGPAAAWGGVFKTSTLAYTTLQELWGPQVSMPMTLSSHVATGSDRCERNERTNERTDELTLFGTGTLETAFLAPPRSSLMSTHACAALEGFRCAVRVLAASSITSFSGMLSSSGSSWRCGAASESSSAGLLEDPPSPVGAAATGVVSNGLQSEEYGSTIPAFEAEAMAASSSASKLASTYGLRTR